MNYRKIVVSDCSGIGDAILTTPVLKAIKDKFPDSKLTFLTRPKCYDVIHGLDFVDEVIGYHKETQSMWSVVKKIWRYDLAICLDYKYRTGVMVYLARIPVRAGIGHKRKFFLTHSVNVRDTCDDQYQPYNCVDIITDSLGIKLEGNFDRIYLPTVSNMDKEKVNQLFHTNRISPTDKLFVVSPFTSWSPKDWPIQYYERLIRRVLDSSDCRVLMIGMDADRLKLGGLRQYSQVVNLMGHTNVMQMVEVIRRASVVMSGCSSSLHMAAALGTPYIGVYGPSMAKRYAPRSVGIALEQPVHCRPCHKEMDGCIEKPCMTGITVNEVYAAFLKLMDRSM